MQNVKIRHLLSRKSGVPSINFSMVYLCWELTRHLILHLVLQVGPASGSYVLTVGGFNEALSTLGDSMTHHNGMKFSTK